MPKVVSGAIRDRYKAMGLTQDDFADEVQISRPQIANGLLGRFGFSADAVARMKAWMIAGR